MSRHRNLRYDVDEYYDDYERDDYVDMTDNSETRQSNQRNVNLLDFGKQKKGKQNKTCNVKAPPPVEVEDTHQDDQISNILAIIGSHDKTGIDDAEVRRIYQSFQRDNEKTLNYLLEYISNGPSRDVVVKDSSSSQISKTVSLSSKKPQITASSKPSNLSSLSMASLEHTNTNSKSTTSSISNSKKSISSESKSDSKISAIISLPNASQSQSQSQPSQARQDLDGMGFSIANMKIESLEKLDDLPPSPPVTAAPPPIKKGDFDFSIQAGDLSDDDFSFDSDMTRPTTAIDSAIETVITKTSNEVTRPHLTMVVAGHVDAGKSTLIGSLLLRLGHVHQRTMHKYEQESKNAGKGSFALAWVMDESESERAHGVTIDIAERRFQTASLDFTVLDAPGHRDFIPNMISGAQQADIAVLVIPATAGEFESSMGSGAQTREHAVLLKALGVNQIIVAINKLDMTTPSPWLEKRFQDIQTAVEALLSELQFPVRNIRYIPVSGLTGENVTSVTPSCPLLLWYSGPTLMDAMDSFHPPVRLLERPVRGLITAVHNQSARTTEVGVRVLQGRLRVGRRVAIPSEGRVEAVRKLARERGNDTKVVSNKHVHHAHIAASGEDVDTLVAGELGTVSLESQNFQNTPENILREGMILCKGPPLVNPVSRFTATILTMTDLIPPVIPGSSFQLYLLGGEVQCHIRQISSMTINTRTKRETKQRPKCVPGGRTASVVIETMRTVSVEPFSSCRSLGRFALRAKGKTCAVGVCDKILS